MRTPLEWLIKYLLPRTPWSVRTVHLAGHLPGPWRTLGPAPSAWEPLQARVPVELRGCAGPTRGGGRSGQTPMPSQLPLIFPQHTKSAKTCSSGLTSHTLCFQNYLTFRLPWSVKGPHCVRTTCAMTRMGSWVRRLLSPSWQHKRCPLRAWGQCSSYTPRKEQCVPRNQLTGSLTSYILFRAWRKIPQRRSFPTPVRAWVGRRSASRAGREREGWRPENMPPPPPPPGGRHGTPSKDKAINVHFHPSRFYHILMKSYLAETFCYRQGLKDVAASLERGHGDTCLPGCSPSAGGSFSCVKVSLAFLPSFLFRLLHWAKQERM